MTEISKSASDIIVVGGGPIGCYLARELARRGYHVTVLEGHPVVGELVHCTGIISLEAFDRFGLDRAAIAASLDRIRVVSTTGLSFTVVPTESRAVVVDRFRFDRTLSLEATRAGAEVVLGTRVTRITVGEERVVAEGQRGGGTVRFRGSLLVLATGVDQTLSRPLGLARTRVGWLNGAQLTSEMRSAADAEVHLGRTVAPGGFAWMVPSGGVTCRVGMLTRDHPRPRLEAFAQALRSRGLIGDYGPSICRPVPCGPRLPSFADRVLAVGDAAGQVKTTTGGGIYFGLIGADAAVETIHQAFAQRDLGAAALADYERTWTASLSAEQRLGKKLRNYLHSLRDRDVDTLFRFLMATRVVDGLGELDFDRHCAGLLGMLGRRLQLHDGGDGLN